MLALSGKTEKKADRGWLLGGAGGGLVGVERAQQRPMLPLALFRRPGFAVGNAAAAAMNLATVGLLFVFNLYLQDVLHYPALAAGLALVPLYLPLCLLAPIGGRVITRTGAKGPMIAGLLAAAADVALLIPLRASSGYLAMLPGLVLWSAGLGVLTPAVVAAAVAAVPQRARRARLRRQQHRPASRHCHRSRRPRAPTPARPPPAASSPASTTRH